MGIAPFHMSHIHAHGLPPLPGLSRFPELNVRTYVTVGDKPGVYFFSLDAAHCPAVWAARRFYQLPYFHARMSVVARESWITYESRRYAGEAQFRGRYRAVSEVRLCEKGSLENWLTERYCLYTTRSGRVYCAEIHHRQWPLQDAEAEIEINSMASAAGITLPQSPPFLHFARRLDVLIWSLRELKS
ncbi:MAG: hypothetical protein DMG87_13640 [Acidobacteria bacterium]|nr:MAG: hypothetical protein DMG87_13640 [Acidobacteriota bacterium]